MYKSGIELPKVSFSTITYAKIPLGGYFIGFDLDNSGKLSKVDNAGVITVIEGGGPNGPIGSVTGLDTDNTDPQNPIVKIAVDGTTITGLGTSASPLIANGTPYTLPAASTTILGGIKIGTGLSIDGSDFLSTAYINLQKVISATYVLTDADNDYTIFVNNGAIAISISLGAITIPNFSVGFIQEGTADVTLVGVTNPIGLKLKGQGYQAFIERKLSTSTYYLLGNTKA